VSNVGENIPLQVSDVLPKKRKKKEDKEREEVEGESTARNDKAKSFQRLYNWQVVKLLNMRFVCPSITTSTLIMILIFVAVTPRQASAVTNSFVIGDGVGFLGCPDGSNHPGIMNFSATDNGKTVRGKITVALSDGSITGTGKITKGQVAKNHYVLEGNWNRGGLCGLTDSQSFSVSGVAGHSVLFQFFDVCSNCEYGFSGTVIITPTEMK
jgi:hypothetical protein